LLVQSDLLRKNKSLNGFKERSIKLEITFLGTGTSQGVPTIACDCDTCRSTDFKGKRLRSSIHISTQGLSIVIDTGPDFRQQILQNRIKKLDAIFYTHQHKDHTAGMDDVRGFNFKQGHDIPVFGTNEVIAQLKQEFSYVFAEKKYPGAPGVEVNIIDGSPFTFKGLEVVPIWAMHYKLPVLGFRIGDFTYLTDANHIEQEELNKIKGSKVFVINGLQFEPHISHFTVEEALEVIKEVNPESAYLTHISHRLGKHEEVSSRLPNGVFLAYDGLRISL
jgi:phosphoribosyl 1,2-cyclic phosphate phosphodiesterase